MEDRVFHGVPEQRAPQKPVEGGAQARHEALDPDTLLRDADAAMHRAKTEGSARSAVFAQSMRAIAVGRAPPRYRNASRNPAMIPPASEASTRIYPSEQFISC